MGRHPVSTFGPYGLSAVAILFALTGTASAVTYVVASNSQIGPGTVAGHHPPTGKHANVIAGSVNATDLADGAVTSAKIADSTIRSSDVKDGSIGAADLADPAIVTVANAATVAPDPCASLKTDIYCGFQSASYWARGPVGGGGDWEPVTVTNDLQGFVHLQGMAHCVTTLNPATACPTIFILPVRLRPSSGLTFPVDCGGSSARIDVSPLGIVRWEPSSGCDPTNYLSLSGVIFHAS